tara:strand:+ start:117 stop:506 length:390 start_codon:yes stop_codon:yes gene_type:complete
MAIYNSTSLDRPVLTTELPSLTINELQIFYQELIECINEIATQLEEVSTFEKKHGHAPDSAWEYRAKKKLRISMQFATKIETIKKPLPKSYDQRYQDHFMRILLEELGPTALKKIQAEASTIARSESNE